jgi:hypothetical protein
LLVIISRLGYEPLPKDLYLKSFLLRR